MKIIIYQLLYLFFQILQNNLDGCDSEILDIPNTPSDFSLVDVSLLDHDSLLEKIDDSERDILPNNESVISTSFSTILNKNCENAKKYVTNQEDLITKLQDDIIKEAKQIKWREKYAKQYRKKYNCDLCFKVFTKYSKLLEHDRVDHKDIVREDICLQCNQIFVSNYRLKVHTDVKHKEKLFNCDICGLSSVSKKSLEVHKLRHSGRFVCDVCGVAMSTSRSLQDHIRSHSEDKSFKCETCQRCFKQQQSLDLHVKRHNPHLLPEYQCSICCKVFKNSHQLNIHKTTHNNENSTMCEICGKTFKNKSTLYIHKLTHKEKKHVCMTCNKMFTTKNLLTRHLQTHGPGNFVCLVCDKPFNRNDTLKNHMKLHFNV